MRAKLADVRAAMAGPGTEIANTIPTVLRAMPFIPLYPILGPRGQRWVPMHGILPFSKLKDFHARISKLHGRFATDVTGVKEAIDALIRERSSKIAAIGSKSP